MKRIHLLTAALLGILLIQTFTACAGAGARTESIPVWQFCHGLRDGLETAEIKCFMTDCEEGLIPVEMTGEEIEEIRRLAINGTVTGKANDLAVTGGTWVYTFRTPEGKHLLSVELYRGLIVSRDGMYHYQP